MDEAIRNRVAEIQQTLEQEELCISMADPVSKMMLVALAHQAYEIDRKIEGSITRLSEKFCYQVLQNCDLHALPAVSIIKIENGKEYSPYLVDETTAFSLKSAKCNFRPLFRTQIVPGSVICSYADGVLHYPYQEPILAQKDNIQHSGEVWIAYEAASEVDSLEATILALNHPLSSDTELTVEVNNQTYILRPAMEEEVYGLNSNFMLIEYWKQHLIYHRLWLYRFDGAEHSMPIMKCDMPVWMYEMFDSETLAPISARRYFWLRIASPSGCTLQADSHIEFNCLPVAEYDINTVKLSYTEPIKPLENMKNDMQFLDIVQDAELADEYFVRDFDVNQYDNSRISEDILNLYRHYIDDYYAFVDSNALNDGTTLRNLRMAMVQITDALSDISASQKPFNGVYAIRNPRNNQQPILISYIVTHGEKGNQLKAGTKMTCSLTAAGEVLSLTDAVGGRNKISGNMTRRELAKFEVNSNDRLFTKIDILNYCKLEFLRAFGDDALRFCKISSSEGMMPVDNHIEKCLNITFSFTSERYYNMAKELNFEEYLQINVEMRKSYSWTVKIIIL